MTIKATYIITNMNIEPHPDNGPDYDAMEYKTEKAALKAAGQKLAEGCDDEVWVWKLSHVVSKPPLDPEIETAN